MSKISLSELLELVDEQLPFARENGFVLEDLGEGAATVRAPYDRKFLRPGDTIAGPVMMGLADYGIYAALLSEIGVVPLAVTTSLHINFLSRPGPSDLIAKARIMKRGKRLAVGEVEIYSDGEDALVAHVTATYSIPPEKKGT